MTTGPGDEKAAGGPGRGHFRASHADRERVIAALKAPLIQGRLTKDEFGSRVGRALGSRTYAELAALIADIPAGLTGPAARNAPHADNSPPHRRRARGIAGSLAAIAVVVATISVASLSHRPAVVPAPMPAGAVMYVAASNGMTPVTAGTNTAGKPIKIGAIPTAIAITPDGKTAYIADEHPATVTPVTTATGTPGKPINIGGFPWAIAITPDGKTAYTVDIPAYGQGPTRVIPVATATNTPGKPIKISDIVGLSAAIAITPDGKTAYIVTGAHTGTTVTPIAATTNTPGKPINIGSGPPGRTRSRSRRTGRPPTSSAPPLGEQRSHRSRPPPTHPANRSTSAVSAVSPQRPRSRSRRTGRPPTSPMGTTARSYRSRPPPARRASRSTSAAPLKGSRSPLELWQRCLIRAER